MTTLNNLVIAVIAQSGLSATGFNDCANNSADAGFNGFIYNVETEAFYDANKSDILAQLEELKDGCYDSETSMFEMVSGFGRGSDLEIETSLLMDNEEGELESDGFDNEVIFTTTDYDMMEEKAFIVDSSFKNLMAWFALEEVSRFISDMLEEDEEDCYHSDTTMTNLEYVKSLGVDCEEWEENNK